MLQRCDRCESMDHCVYIDDISMEQNLHKRIQAILASSNYKVLCPRCIEEYHNAGQLVNAYPGKEFIEGIHYYHEGSLMVLTLAFHIRKGYCCKNKCRHCPYGYK